MAYSERPYFGHPFGPFQQEPPLWGAISLFLGVAAYDGNKGQFAAPGLKAPCFRTFLRIHGVIDISAQGWGGMDLKRGVPVSLRRCHEVEAPLF